MRKFYSHLAGLQGALHTAVVECDFKSGAWSDVFTVEFRKLLIVNGPLWFAVKHHGKPLFHSLYIRTEPQIDSRSLRVGSLTLNVCVTGNAHTQNTHKNELVLVTAKRRLAEFLLLSKWNSIEAYRIQYVCVCVFVYLTSVCFSSRLSGRHLLFLTFCCQESLCVYVLC